MIDPFEQAMRDARGAYRDDPGAADRIWNRIDRELQRQQRRGRFVAITARVLLFALIAATGFVLSWSFWRWL